MISKECLICNKEFKTYPSRIRIRKGKYCSKQCSDKNSLFEKGHTPWTKGKKGIHYSPITEFKKGNPSWNKGLKTGIHHKKQFKKGMIPWNKDLEGYMSGDKHWNWKGGITPIRKKLRETYAHRKWRMMVFKRDGYICKFCGSKEKLEADHIKRWKEYPELRYELSNGRTLCRRCHMKTDTYGNRKYQERSNLA